MSDAGAHQRRLTTIVAIDVAGYSSMVEADEGRALADTARLQAEVVDSAGPLGGRMFKTAGDGFLLEFPTVTGALEATDALRDRAALPIRIGVHLGEVSVTPDGDLLGHGVNVAARLQAKAPVDGVLVSADVVRAVRGPIADRFAARGRIQLDKMRETLAVYTFERIAGAQRPHPPYPARKPRGGRAAAAAAAVVVVAAVAGTVAWRLKAGSPTAADAVRIGVLPLETISPSATLRDLARGVADRTLSALSTAGLPAIAAPTAQAGDAAPLLVGGFVQQAANGLQATIHITDAKAHVMLWSQDFHAAPADAAGLQEQAAVKVADMLVCGVRAYDGSATLDAQAKTLWFRVCDLKRQNANADQVRDALRAILAKAPDFAGGYSILALTSAISLFFLPDAQREAVRLEAHAAAQHALELNPKDPDSYIALSLLVPNVQDWATREHWLLKGVAEAPSGASLLNYEANLLRQVGRLKDATTFATRSLALDPLAPVKTVTVAIDLYELGRTAQADQMLQRSEAAWPGHPAIRSLAAWRDMAADDPSAFLARLADPARRPASWTDAEVELWRRYAAVRQGSVEQKRRFGRVLTDAVAADAVDATMAVRALLLLNQEAAVYEVMERRGDAVAALSPLLFTSEAARLRRDPRFMGLAARFGLVSYWTQTGKWPDFCTEPGLPYDCRAAAAKAAKS